MSASSRNYNTPRSETSQDEDRELIPELLLMTDLYENTNPKVVGVHMTNSIMTAEEVIRYLIDKTFRVVREHYYESKMTPHVLSATHNLIEICFTTDMIFSDDVDFTIDQDEEASRPTMDNWGRGKIASKRYDLSHEKTLNEGKRVLQKAQEEAKRFITELDPSTFPGPVNLEDEEIDEVEKATNQYREIKERERLRALQLKQEALNNQVKPKKNELSLGKKPYTFDYDGKPILTKGVKIEKLPQPALHVNYSLPSLTTNEIMEREKLKKKEIVSLKGKNKLLPDYDKLLANKYVPEQHDIFNMFSPEKGVKFYDNGREKRGAYFDNASTASFIDGSLVSHTGAQIRLTKEEYHNITHDGMLRRKSDVQTFSNQKNTSKTEDSYKDILNDNSREEGGAKKSKYTKILSPELLESLTADNNNDQSVIKLPAIMQHSFSYSKPIQKSPIDNFNIEILKNKDWGKPGMVGALSSPPNLPKNKKEIAKGLSYAQLAKLPRERHLNMKTKHHEEGHN